MNDIAKLRIEINSSPVKEAASANKELAQASIQVDKAVNRQITSINKHNSQLNVTIQKLQQQITALNSANMKQQEFANKAKQTEINLKQNIKALNDEIKALKAEKDEMRASISELNKKIDALQEMKQETIKLTGVLQAMKGVVGLLKGFLVGFFAQIGIQGVGAIIKLVDSLNLLKAKVKAVMTDATQFSGVFEQMINVSNRTGASIDTVSQAFVRLSPAAQELGVTNDKLLQFSETFLKMGALAGASANEVNNAMIQLSQGMASGTLRGDELRSILEQMQPVARAIAESMGLSFGEFREAAAEGKVTAEEVFNAIINKTDEVNKKFEELPGSVDRSMNKISNALKIMLDDLNQVTGATETLSGALDATADFITNVLAPAIVGVTKFILQMGETAIQAGMFVWNSFKIGFTAIATSISSAVGLALQAIENLVNGAAKGINFVINLANKVPGVNIGNIGTGFKAPGHQIADDAASFSAGLLKNQTRENSQLFSDIISGKSVFNEYQSGGLTKALGKTKPRLKNKPSEDGSGGSKSATDKDIEKQAEFIRSIQSESQELRRLHEAQKISTEARKNEERVIEAENMVLKAGLDFRKGVGKAAYDQIRANQELELSTKKLAEEEKRKQDLDKQITDLTRQKTDAQRLYTAQLTGDSAAKNVAVELEKERAIREATKNLIGDEITKVTELINEIYKQKEATEELKKSQAFDKRIEDLELEIENTRRLTDAIRGGEQAVRDTEIAIRAEAEARALGAEATDKQKREVMALIETLEREKDAQQQAQERYQKFKQLGESVGDAFYGAFERMITGAQSFKESLRQLTAELTKLLLKAAIQPIFQKIFGLGFGALAGGFGGGGAASFLGPSLGINGLLPSANGNAFSNGRVIPFAKGGITSGPELFGMSGNNIGLRGEAGTEAILPLKRMADGNLGVISSGSGGSSTTVINTPITVNVEGGSGSGDDEKDQKLGDKVAKAVEQQVRVVVRDELNQQRRPGGMSNPGLGV